ncbi:MAG: sigma-70 family RNA polymerase sigma factor [Ruminococcus sp.]|nr:sigma-70 family RNA polymerase sigma factor [Ruminococcus sp.]
MTDENIIKLYFDRNEKAISATKDKYGKYLYKIAYNILHIKEDSEESVDDTYLGAWNTIPPKKPSVLKTYLCKLTRNISLKRFRTYSAQKRGGAQTTLALSELEDILVDSESTEEKIERNELLKFIKQFVSDLKTEQRQIFLARYFYLYSVKDIAHKLGYTESKIKVTLMRTRDRLYERIKEEGLI